MKITKTFRSTCVKAEGMENAVVATISTAGVDRDHERVLPAAFKKNLGIYKQHPILLSSHEYRGLMNQIGEAVPSSIDITKDGVKAIFQYYVGKGNPEADWAYFLAQKGKAAFSIGFIPLSAKNLDGDADGAVREYDEIELLEVSQVTVPSNRGGLQDHRSKGFLNDQQVKEFTGLLAEFEKQIKAAPPAEAPDAGAGDDGEPAAPEVIEVERTPAADFVPESMEDVDISAEEGISASVGKLVADPEGAIKVQAFYFAADKWDAEKASAWVKEKGQAAEDALNKPEEPAEEPAPAEGEKPADDEAPTGGKGLKQGRVLSTKNETLVKSAVMALNAASEALNQLLQANTPVDPGTDAGKQAKKIFDEILSMRDSNVKAEQAAAMMDDAAIESIKKLLT